MGNSVYVFGGGRNQSDIMSGRFDCSSFVYWAYSQLGVKLRRTNLSKYRDIKNIGTAIEEKNMKLGDLVFLYV
ncbi:NlpC/P60 family protein [Bacillales bacterium AN1005]